MIIPYQPLKNTVFNGHPFQPTCYYSKPPVLTNKNYIPTDNDKQGGNVRINGNKKGKSIDIYI